MARRIKKQPQVNVVSTISVQSTILLIFINPLVPDAHYSVRHDKPFSLQSQRLEVDLKLNCGFLFCAPWALMG